MDESTRKLANELHFAVKGFLINDWYDDETVMSIYNSYLKRLWGNHERLVYSREAFEKAWEERVTKMSQYNNK